MNAAHWRNRSRDKMKAFDWPRQVFFDIHIALVHYWV